MSEATSNHAYGIGMIALLVGMSASIVFYTSFYLPESLLRPSVSEHILHPEEMLTIDIVEGALTEGNENYVPNKATAVLTQNNHVVWVNHDSTGHTVTPSHRYTDSYSGSFDSDGVILPGESYEFIFTEEHEPIDYFCIPHPWMTGTIGVERSRF
ncbi:MAG: plastocyanin/azurin family copper-binding protein [Nitrosopumilus sp.]|nr:plastocyanin/azurin family copper-binding protein [Nitrosopumilus sp.]CAI9831916.1 Blue (Type 1) copper domain protein [Nitrosopumilaceae archaeon]MDA7941792.1 plastocyanin/azurin family copper-binding protein [Nitrosopumilus sp.]MDA7943947.1 plastocyanin/azurin family copper-binding protein [Nitrosopumilus sp.]MDA7944724.1 plastocyanin/azurin family copper-binding protein [Nitrosopumilus sp.]